MIGLQDWNYLVLHVASCPVILVLRAIAIRGGQHDYRVQSHAHKFLFQREPQPAG